MGQNVQGKAPVFRTLALALAAALALLPVCAGKDMARAADEPGVGRETRLPIPRWVSLRSAEINVRRGPGLDYRKDWVFRRSGLPVRVVEEYGSWRRIADRDAATGWVYHALLSGRRTVLVTAETVTLRAKGGEDAKPVAIAEEGVVARLLACAPDWCEIEKDSVRGWTPKTTIWGVDPDEVFDR